MEKFVNLTHDKIFKYVFSDEEIVKKFLNDYFKYLNMEKEIEKVRVTPQNIIMSKNYFIKDFYGDIVVYLTNGDIVFVEMANKFGDNEYKKAVSYLTRLYSN